MQLHATSSNISLIFLLFLYSSLQTIDLISTTQRAILFLDMAYAVRIMILMCLAHMQHDHSVQKCECSLLGFSCILCSLAVVTDNGECDN